MAWDWGKIIEVALPIVIDLFKDKDKDGEGEGEDSRSLVRPRPPEVPKQREVTPFKPGSRLREYGGKFGKRGGIVGAEPALKAVDPSTLETKYWEAIFSDAKSKSRISLTGIGEKRD